MDHSCSSPTFSIVKKARQVVERLTSTSSVKTNFCTKVDSFMIRLPRWERECESDANVSDLSIFPFFFDPVGKTNLKKWEKSKDGKPFLSVSVSLFTPLWTSICEFAWTLKRSAIWPTTWWFSKKINGIERPALRHDNKEGAAMEKNSAPHQSRSSVSHPRHKKYPEQDSRCTGHILSQHRRHAWNSCCSSHGPTPVKKNIKEQSNAPYATTSPFLRKSGDNSCSRWDCLSFVIAAFRSFRSSPASSSKLWACSSTSSIVNLWKGSRKNSNLQCLTVWKPHFRKSFLKSFGQSLGNFQRRK